MKADRIVLGVAIIVIGVVWLLVNLGLLTAATVAELWRFWPVLLVLWGLLLLLGKGSSLPGFLLIFLVVLAFLSGTFSFSSLQGTGETITTTISKDENIESMRLELVQHAGEFYLQAHDKENLAEIHIQSTISPEIQQTRTDNVVEVAVRDREKYPHIKKRFSRWDINVQEKIPLEVLLQSGAINAELDLSQLNVSNLSIKAGAGELAINLGPAVDKILVESGACSIDVNIPANVGVRLKTSGALISVDSDDGRVISVGDRRYESKGLESKDALVDIEIKAAAGKITLHHYEVI